MAYPNLMNQKLAFVVLKYRWLWMSISAIFLIPCIVAMIYSCVVNPNHAPIKLGIDFTGGTIVKYSVDQNLTIKDVENVRQKLIEAGIKSPVVQSINAQVAPDGQKSNLNNLVSIKTSFIEQEDTATISKINSVLSTTLKNPKVVQTNSVGPTLGGELLKNSLTAVALAFLAICVYISLRFQYEYAVVTLLTIVHDLIIIMGLFSILSIFFDMHIDSLFITALLTSIGYSVHDTIVVFDRIRENNRFLAKKYSFDDIVNASVSQTLARSINTSLTLVLTLLALYFFGGATTKDFILAMLVGTIIGTYSSIFFGSVVLDFFMRGKGVKTAVSGVQA